MVMTTFDVRLGAPRCAGSARPVTGAFGAYKRGVPAARWAVPHLLVAPNAIELQPIYVQALTSLDGFHPSAHLRERCP